MKKLVIKSTNLKEPPIVISYVETVVDPARCMEADLSIIRQAIYHRNHGVERSVYFEIAKESIARLKKIGCEVEIQDVE